MSPDHSQYRKALIVGTSYSRCMSVYKMLPWNNFGYKPMVEMNACSSLLKI